MPRFPMYAECLAVHNKCYLAFLELCTMNSCARRPAHRLLALSREPEMSPWMHWATPSVCRAALLGVVLVLMVIAYFPFAWSPPCTVRNEVTRTTDGSLRFGDMNNARTPGTPAWLPEVRLRPYPDAARG